jgi:hypothetical protein
VTQDELSALVAAVVAAVSAGKAAPAQVSTPHVLTIGAVFVNRRGIFTPDRRAIGTPLVVGVVRVGGRSCGV